MIYSMTAFARQEVQANWGSAIWELRSVNHRYLEINARLPDALSALEPLIREKIKSKLQRGKLDITLRYKPTVAESSHIKIDAALVQQLVNVQSEITSLVEKNMPFNMMDILRWPGVLLLPEEDMQQIQTDLLIFFEQALNEFITVRQREGEALEKLLQQRLSAMLNEIGKVEKYLPTILKTQRDKLTHRFHEAKLTVDMMRFEQEMVLFAQKIDVTEEIDRLNTHLKEVTRTLQQGGAVGRRLDFLLQELNREANTLGSKAVISETTMAAVELKVLIEQIREQVQNLE